MKTEEQIAGENDGFTILRNDHSSIEFIRAIREEAIKHGITLAAQQCETRRAFNEIKQSGYLAGESKSCHHAILQLRDNFKLI